MAKLSLEIVTPKEVIYKGEADIVTIPGSKSPFQVLPNHAAIVSSLDNGKLIFRNGSEQTEYKTSSGIAEVNNNKISVLVEEAEKL
jgi:F-type H+-transporting ATPase subunit epsilon